MLYNSDSTYGLVSKALHWLMAAVIVALLVLGLYMEGLPEEAAGRHTLYDLHKSFGMLILFLVVLRIGWTLYSRPPQPPKALQTWEVWASKGAALAFYGLMVLIPVSGYMMSTLAGYPVKFFGLTLPALVAKNEQAAGTPHEVHEIASYVLIAILVAHVAGALKHRFIDKGEADVLARMLRGPAESRT